MERVLSPVIITNMNKVESVDVNFGLESKGEECAKVISK